MDNLDAMLARLAQRPMPADFDGMEARVLARIAARPVARAGLGIGSVTVAVALTMGVLGAGLPMREASAMTQLSPLGSHSPLAPSTLLLGEP